MRCRKVENEKHNSVHNKPDRVLFQAETRPAVNQKVIASARPNEHNMRYVITNTNQISKIKNEETLRKNVQKGFIS
jgi:hypothetical protein